MNSKTLPLEFEFSPTLRGILLGAMLMNSRPQISAQTASRLEIQTYAGLTITGAVGAVCSIEYVTDLAQTNNASAWRCLEFLQLPASPYLWIDTSLAASDQRFYRAAAFSAPTNMVFIPPGTFKMGSPTNESTLERYPLEGPQTSVRISKGFWMQKYEVTQADYLAVVGNNPSWFNGSRIGQTNNTPMGRSPGRDFGADLSRPVELVSWEDATEFCGKLTQIELAAGRIPSNSSYRLPTEAEWEYACRAWTSTRFSYGEDFGCAQLTNFAWFAENAGSTTHPVGQKLPNPWGLYDMHGNVWEWCQDWLGPYPGGIALDPQGPAWGQFHAIRGGGFTLDAPLSRSADRCNYCYPSKNCTIGFRVVLASDHQ